MKKFFYITLYFTLGIIGSLSPAGQVLAQSNQETAEKGFADLLTGLKESIPRVLIAFVVLVVAIIIAKFAQKAAQRALLRSSGHEAALSFVGKTAFSVCVTIGFTIALSIVGIDISFIVGAASFGLGFALKDILENYVAGVLILLQEPFKIGDVVEIKEYFGRIEEIQARSTMIRIWDGQRVVIPNSFMISEPLKNFSTYPERRMNIKIGVSYDTDLNQVTQVIHQALSKHEEILKDPAPSLTINEFGSSSINMTARFWIDGTVSNWLVMTTEAIKLIKEAFDEAGINIPFPITTLSMNPQDSDDMYKFFETQKRAGKV